MKIGENIDLGVQPLLLAPMEDVTDPSFRWVCKEFGADMMYTEFISSDGLIRDARKSQAKLLTYDYEAPVGIQIYGNNTDSTVKTENIHFDNCRFEMPSLRYPNAKKAYVNACIMLQTEFSDGDNMSFENCYINGGGYSMYAHGTKGTKLSNITFRKVNTK